MGANDVTSMIVSGPKGVYLAGTGTAGVAGAFFTLGLVYSR